MEYGRGTEEGLLRQISRLFPVLAFGAEQVAPAPRAEEGLLELHEAEVARDLGVLQDGVVERAATTAVPGLGDELSPAGVLAAELGGDDPPTVGTELGEHSGLSDGRCVVRLVGNMRRGS